MTPDSSPWTIKEYQQTSLSSAKSGCVKVFQSLGAFSDQIVVIGGLIPALLIDQSGLDNEDPKESHVGPQNVVKFFVGEDFQDPLNRSTDIDYLLRQSQVLVDELLNYL